MSARMIPIAQSLAEPRELLVECPREGEAVRLERCLACGLGQGVEVVGAREAYVRCLVDDPRAPRGDRRSAVDVPVSEIMTREVATVAPDTSLDSVVWMLLTGGFGGAPVVDAAGALVGIVTASDLLRHPADGPRDAAGVKARDVMTPVVLTLPEAAPVALAAALMAHERVHRLPVVAESGAVVGIVSSLDVLRWVARSARFVVPDA